MTIIDFNSADLTGDIESDICVIGAGPAGISLALKLASATRQVSLFEAGGSTPSTDSQKMYSGTTSGLNYFPLDSTRIRAVGGSTGHWSGWCGPLNPIDFRKRPWIPNSGWPITYEDLLPYYNDAQSYIQLGEFAYNLENFRSNYPNFPEFETKNLVPRFWQFSSPPLNFGLAYRDRLENHDYIKLYKNANVTELKLNREGNHVQSIVVKSLSGKSLEASGKQIVVACGGIENARLLLASRSHNNSGIGNDRDMVGRYFMEHPEVEVAKLSEYDAQQMSRFKRLTTKADQSVGVAFCAGEMQQATQKIGNGATFIAAPSFKNVNNGWASFLAIRDAVLERKVPEDGIEHVKKLFADFDTAIGVLALRMRGKETSTKIVQRGFVDVICMCEQSPNPNSRVSLSDQTDALGSPQAHLNWELTALDRRTIHTTVTLMAAEFKRLDLGTVQLSKWLREKSDAQSWPLRLRGGHHHMGTTRMSADPAHGVVDRNCKVHGIDNLHIAGSSVFPTGGYVNPTLTIVALSSRLSDHLKSHLP